MDVGAACWKRYQSGDESGFDDLLTLYRENLIFFLLRFLPTIEDAEDAAEDAFVSLLLHPYREEKGASLKTYLFTLGRSRALDLRKRQHRQEKITFRDFSGDRDALELEERLCREENRRTLLTAMDKLPEQYREALHLLYFEELSLEETAKVMKKSKKQVENLSYRGKQALKEQLDKEGMDP